jgi:hypothetical protein
MEEAPENGKESSHSAHASGMNVLSKRLETLAQPTLVASRKHAVFRIDTVRN